MKTRVLFLLFLNSPLGKTAGVVCYAELPVRSPDVILVQRAMRRVTIALSVPCSSACTVIPGSFNFGLIQYRPAYVLVLCQLL